MSDLVDKSAMAVIDDFISQALVQEALAHLTTVLPDGAVVYMVGGAIRNLIISLFHGRCPAIEDIDLFIDGIPKGIHLKRLLPDTNFRQTDLGGVRWNPKGSAYAIDICLMQDFVIIKKYGLSPGLDTLLETLDFTMNALVYDIGRQQLYERNALAHIKERVLEFNTRKLYSKTTIAYRTLLLRYKTGFTLSRDVFNFVKQAIDIETLTEVKRILHNRLGKKKQRDIIADYDRICSFGTFDDYSCYISEMVAKAP